jgi:hypothetical protein
VRESCSVRESGSVRARLSRARLSRRRAGSVVLVIALSTWLSTLVLAGCGRDLDNTATVRESVLTVEAPGESASGDVALVAPVGGSRTAPGQGAARTPAPRSGAAQTPAALAAPRSDAGQAPRPVVLPPANAGLDYQLGGAYPLPEGVTVVSRDREDPPADGAYNICYVNGFQTQPGERDFWLTTYPTLVLRNAGGVPLEDPEWPGEMILDTSTAAKRSVIVSVVGGWISGCHTAGYQAVEIDNLDTYTRFPTRLTEADAVLVQRALSDRAHRLGMAMGQKNSADLVVRRAEMATDFAVVEQCGEYDECGVFTDGYGDAVLSIEYTRPNFDEVCAQYPQLSVVLRDVNLSVPGSAAYVFDSC